MNDELREELEKIGNRLTALERFQTTLTALGLGLGALITFFADTIRKKLGF